MFIAIKYETKSSNDSKEVIGIYESVKAFEDNVIGIKKHKFFNEYFDSKFTYVLREKEVQVQKAKNVLSYCTDSSVLKFMLDSTAVSFKELKEMKYCLTYPSMIELISTVKRDVQNKLIHPSVGTTIENNIRKIYTFSF